MDICPIGTIVLLKDFEFEEFEVAGYSSYCQISGDTYENALYYKLKNTKSGFVRQVIHDLITPKEDSNKVAINIDLSTDELLDTYRNYKELYAAFGEEEYFLKLLEIESKLNSKTQLRRGR